MMRVRNWELGNRYYDLHKLSLPHVERHACLRAAESREGLWLPSNHGFNLQSNLRAHEGPTPTGARPQATDNRPTWQRGQARIPVRHIAIRRRPKVFADGEA